MQPLGAGGYGIVFSHGPGKALKLLYDVETGKALRQEAEIQELAWKALAGSSIRVPKVLAIDARPLLVAGTWYLCGIEMEQVPVLPEFGEPIHMLLGYDGDDLDTSWGRSTAAPPGPNNPSRGFFAGPELLEALWAEEGVNLTIESVARTMGATLRALLAAGIIPNDLEWIYGGKGRIYLLDFGLCRKGHKTPEALLQAKGSEGLAGDIYLPGSRSRGAKEFLEGFLQS